MLDYIILGMVLDEALCGYDIKKAIEKGVGVFYKASYGSVYPGLRRLTDRGDLVMREEPRGERTRKLYGATQAGRASFMSWLASPLNVLDGTSAHLAKVYFFDRLAPDRRDEQLRELEANNQAYLRELQTLERDFAQHDTAGYYHRLSTLYYGIRVVQESIRWCQHIRAGKPLAELIETGD